MFDKEAVIKLQEGASISQAQGAMMISSSTKDTVALPSDFKVHDLEKYLPTRRRARGNMQTESLKDFASYFANHKEEGATVFVDQDKMRAVGVLNLGMPGAPGHADNTGTLSMVPTPAYDAFRDVCNGGARTQGQVAEWLEDWQDLIRCYHVGAEDMPSPELRIQSAIAAVRNITIDSARKVESEEGQLSASKGSFESVKASSKHTLPTHIHLRTEAYAGMLQRVFIIRLGILTGGDKVSLSLRPVKMEEHKQEMAEEFAEMVRTNLIGAPVLVGRYEVK
jgi:uncharacterized protein YfdQ (DUF2303 family)